MADEPQIGSRWTYTAETSLGQKHASGALPAEMVELDLHPGTTVAVAGHDHERGLVLVEWTDRSGNPRTTSVEPATFADHFTEA
jgi:hypothetical protein